MYVAGIVMTTVNQKLIYSFVRSIWRAQSDQPVLLTIQYMYIDLNIMLYSQLDRIGKPLLSHVQWRI